MDMQIISVASIIGMIAAEVVILLMAALVVTGVYQVQKKME